jgi:two-component system, cell cycle sensor histidine kinase and response regulator CckA
MSHTATRLPDVTAWNMASPLRVLVIEHARADAELYLHELQKAGFQCRPHIVSTPEEFRDHFRRFHYDIVLANYHLPNWTGMDALSEIRKSGNEVPFILVTRTLGEEVAVECIRQGVTDCVLKDHAARLPAVVLRALKEQTSRDARTFMVEALRQSESNSLFLFAHNPLPMWVFEKGSLQFLQVNDAALHHYGYERVEFLRMNVSELHPAEEIPGFLRMFHEGSIHERTPRQWHHRLKNGTLIDVDIFMHSMEYSGRASALVVALDITERKRAEQEKQKFFTLVENSGDFIAVADLKDNIQYVNPAGREMLGMGGVDSVQGTHSIDYVIPEDLSLVHETIFPAINSFGHWKGELRFRHQQTGHIIPMDCVAFQVKDPRTGEARYIATVSRDITERRSLEQQLRQAQKFEAIGQLAGGIAHDFNNVIGAILGWAELGEQQTASSEAPYATYFKKIHTQCDRVTALIRQLLAFARRQILEPQNIDLNQTVREVLALLGGVIGKDVELQTTLADDLSVVRVDPTQLEQVLMNLCINARDAMPKGGRLSIETHNADFSAVQCRQDAGLQPGRFVALSVSDTGGGMDSVVRERIFEPFFTTKGIEKSTGLGLATVYGIVKQHGGFIRVDSEPGHGSKFHIFLPVSEIVATVENSPPFVANLPVRGGTETILLAEDHEGLREMAQATLESLGYRFLVAHDGEEAVKMFSAQRDSIALILLDVIMPRRSGPEVYEAIRTIKPGVPVVFVTAYSNETAALTEMVERGIPVLRKPYSSGALSRRVREALDLVAARSSKSSVKPRPI